MECYSEQIVAIAADGELEVEETLRLRDHLATCRRCRQLLDALRAENRILSETLQELPEEAASPMVFPCSPWSVGWGEAAVVVTVLAAVTVSEEGKESAEPWKSASPEAVAMTL